MSTPLEISLQTKKKLPSTNTSKATTVQPSTGSESRHQGRQTIQGNQPKPKQQKPAGLEGVPTAPAALLKKKPSNQQQQRNFYRARTFQNNSASAQSKQSTLQQPGDSAVYESGLQKNVASSSTSLMNDDTHNNSNVAGFNVLLGKQPTQPGDSSCQESNKSSGSSDLLALDVAAIPRNSDKRVSSVSSNNIRVSLPPQAATSASRTFLNSSNSKFSSSTCTSSDGPVLNLKDFPVLNPASDTQNYAGKSNSRNTSQQAVKAQASESSSSPDGRTKRRAVFRNSRAHADARSDKQKFDTTKLGPASQSLSPPLSTSPSPSRSPGSRGGYRNASAQETPSISLSNRDRDLSTTPPPPDSLEKSGVPKPSSATSNESDETIYLADNSTTVATVSSTLHPGAHAQTDSALCDKPDDKNASALGVESNAARMSVDNLASRPGTGGFLRPESRKRYNKDNKYNKQNSKLLSSTSKTVIVDSSSILRNSKEQFQNHNYNHSNDMVFDPSMMDPSNPYGAPSMGVPFGGGSIMPNGMLPQFGYGLPPMHPQHSGPDQQQSWPHPHMPVGIPPHGMPMPPPFGPYMGPGMEPGIPPHPMGVDPSIGSASEDGQYFYHPNGFEGYEGYDLYDGFDPYEGFGYPPHMMMMGPDGVPHFDDGYAENAARIEAVDDDEDSVKSLAVDKLDIEEDSFANKSTMVGDKDGQKSPSKGSKTNISSVHPATYGGVPPPFHGMPIPVGMPVPPPMMNMPPHLGMPPQPPFGMAHPQDPSYFGATVYYN